MRKGALLAGLGLSTILCVSWAITRGQSAAGAQPSAAGEIALPAPITAGKMSLEEALARRRSVRSFTAEELTMQQIGQLAWAAQGITDQTRGLRTAPSAVATYPLEIYLVKHDGVYRYIPRGHKLARLAGEDRRADLCGQPSVQNAPLDIVIAAAYQRTRERFGARAERYATLEAGHVAQNVLLEAVALGLGAVPVGGCDDQTIANVLGLPAGETPLYIIPVGHPAKR